jgi:hypothetical protein
MNEKYSRTESEKDVDKITLTLIVVVIIAVLFAEVVSFYKTKNFDLDLFSPAIGLSVWFAIYFNSQRIIYKNLFKEVFILGIGIIMICFLKQAFTRFNNISLIISAIPFIYIIYFRFLIRLFYKDYPEISRKPIIVFASKVGSAIYEGKDNGYKPSMKERVFSSLLYVGFILLSLAIVIVTKKIGILD